MRKPLHDIRQLDEEKKETGSLSGHGTHARNCYVSLNSTAILPTSHITGVLAWRQGSFLVLLMVLARFLSYRSHYSPFYFECYRVYKCRIVSTCAKSAADAVRLTSATPSARAMLLSLQFTQRSHQQILFPSKQILQHLSTFLQNFLRAQSFFPRILPEQFKANIFVFHFISALLFTLYSY